MYMVMKESQSICVSNKLTIEIVISYGKEGAM